MHFRSFFILRKRFTFSPMSFRLIFTFFKGVCIQVRENASQGMVFPAYWQFILYIAVVHSADVGLNPRIAEMQTKKKPRVSHLP